MRRLIKNRPIFRVDSNPLLFGLIGGFLLAMPALAQSSTESDAEVKSGIMEEVIVTARKRSENIYDVPESIDAFSANDIERLGIRDVNDLGRQTPGLTLNRRLDNKPNVVIRGVGSFGNVQGTGFYVDEVQNFTDQTMRLEDLERIEVLKGPQGTLYGGSNIGGAIKYVSKIPSYDFGGNFSAEAGTDSARDIYGSINLPLSADRAALRVSGSFVQDDGFLSNSLLNTDNSALEEYTVRTQLLLQPTDKFSTLITGRYRNSKGTTNAYTRHPGPNEVRYDAPTNLVPEANVETTGVVAHLSYDFGAVELVSISSYTRQTRSILYDLDYTSDDFLVVFTQDKVYPSEVYTQELRLTSKVSERFDWILGLYGAKLNNTFGGPNPVYITIGGSDPILGNDSEQKLTDLAAFGTANFYFNDFALGVGLRVQRTKYHALVKTASLAPFDPALSVNNNDTIILPKVSLSYGTEDNLLIYASVAKGYEPGRATITTDPVFNYKAETLWAYEVGVKGEAFSSLLFDFAVFYNKYEDRQFETRSFVNGLQLERIDNIGESNIYGFEAGINWPVTERLTLRSGLSYINAEWGKATYGLDDTSTPVEGDVVNLDLNGIEVPNTPEWMFNFSATYIHPLKNGMQVELHADTAYESETRWTIPDTLNNRTPDYWVTSARISIGPQDGKWKIAARIENAFDKGYYTEFYPNFFGASPDCTELCHLGASGQPRSFYVSLAMDF